MTHRFFSLFAFILLLTGNTLLADSSFSGLKDRYLKLRNNDPSASRKSEWVTLASDFDDFASRHEGSSDTPAALLNAAILYTELFKRWDNENYFEAAQDAYDKILLEYSENSLADDALMRQATLLLEERKDKVAAKKLFKKIIREYPQSEFAEASRVKLTQLSSVEEDDDEEEEGDSDNEKVKAIAPQRKKYLVVIDPGHGGEDFGAQGPGGLLEKDVALNISFELERILKKDPLTGVELTRRVDEFVPLATRTAIANDLDADIFVSVHANASPSKNLSGLQAYYLDMNGDEAAQKLAERENASTQYEGAEADLRYMLSDLTQKGKLDNSVRLARVLSTSVSQSVTRRWKNMANLGVKSAPFYVLVGAHMPCVLMELYFIDNEQDGILLGQEDFRKQLAAGLAQGIQSFLRSKPAAKK